MLKSFEINAKMVFSYFVLNKKRQLTQRKEGNKQTCTIDGVGSQGLKRADFEFDCEIKKILKHIQ